MKKLLLPCLLLWAIAMQAQGIKTSSGYTLINHTKSQGIKPKAGETLKVHAKTIIMDSVLMDTRQGGGGARDLGMPDKSQFQPGQPVPAIVEAMFYLAKGDSATVIQAVDSTLRPYLPENVRSAKEIRYQVVLEDIITLEMQAKAKAETEGRLGQLEPTIKQTIQDFNTGKLDDKLVATKSGLKILIVEKGNGKPVSIGERISTHYYGALMNGNMFDNSFSRGQALPFVVGAGQMIAGYDEGAQRLNHGGKAFFFLPAKLAYGEAGAGESIPPNSDIMFYVEVQ